MIIILLASRTLQNRQTNEQSLIAQEAKRQIENSIIDMSKRAMWWFCHASEGQWLT
jgi:hypothetical protein